jgi:hypothetical protein
MLRIGADSDRGAKDVVGGATPPPQAVKAAERPNARYRDLIRPARLSLSALATLCADDLRCKIETDDSGREDLLLGGSRGRRRMRA